MYKTTIEQQVAALTPEQRANMKPIYRKYFSASILVLLLAVVLGVVSFLLISKAADDAKARLDELDRLTDENPSYILECIDEKLDCIDRYYDMKSLKPMALGVFGIVCILGAIVIYFVFKRKYPYFSEKKYAFIKKQEKLTSPS